MPIRARFARSISGEAFGVAIEIAVEDRQLRPAINAILPPGFRSMKPAADGARFAITETDSDSYQVTAAGQVLIDHATQDVAVGMLDARVRAHIAEHAPNHIFVHAGVVGRGGKVVAIPGRSFSGKTTLVAALLATGAEYYSDEYAALDADGTVHPYARRLSIREVDGGRASTDHNASDLGAAPAAGPAQLSAVISTQYKAGTEWSPEEATSGRGVLAMLSNTVPAQARPQEALSAVTKATAGATVLIGERGEAAATAQLILQRLPWLTA